MVEIINDNTKILHLTLKKKWFDMIASGEKFEEYREMKPYWEKRLCNMAKIDVGNSIAVFKKYDLICFKNGYAKDAPTMYVNCKGISVGWGEQKWGAESRLYYIIKLGTITKIENYGTDRKKKR